MGVAGGRVVSSSDIGECPRHNPCEVWAWQDPATSEIFRRCAVCGWFLHYAATHPRNAPLVEAPVIRSFVRYAADVARTMPPASPVALAIYALGLVGECGEVTEPLKKHLRDGRAIDREHLALELGDVLFYLTAIATTFGITLEEIATANVAKCRERYPNGPPTIAVTTRHAEERS